MLDRKLGRASRIEERNLQVGYLKANVAELKRSGCDVRVIHDSHHAFKTLPDEMGFRPNDSEIAIYDRFRVDVFQGGNAGAITSVTCYTPAVAQFDAYLAQADAYFSTLWDGASDMGEFIAKLESAIGSAEGRIDYESNWLAFYEFGLSQEDIGLKTVESKRVEEVLRREERWGRLRRCLDIGTCTGRYPMLLAAALDPSGTIKGIDDDFDCVRFAKSNVQRHCPGESRIRIEKEDFTAPDTSLTGKFDLITCMLGTLSHFGRERKPAAADGFNDGLQRALARMRSLLADDGLLLLGTWSEQACAGKHLLGIYRDADIDRLVTWTPSLRELRQRIGQAGLSIVEEAHPDVRLDLTVCRHNDGESGNGARS
jgi:SAM-dependent methyltransferase